MEEIQIEITEELAATFLIIVNYKNLHILVLTNLRGFVAALECSKRKSKYLSKQLQHAYDGGLYWKVLPDLVSVIPELLFQH